MTFHGILVGVALKNLYLKFLWKEVSYEREKVRTYVPHIDDFYISLRI